DLVGPVERARLSADAAIVDRDEAIARAGEGRNLALPRHAVAGRSVQEDHRHPAAARVPVEHRPGREIDDGVDHARDAPVYFPRGHTTPCSRGTVPVPLYMKR